jgi:hypothetical protein
MKKLHIIVVTILLVTSKLSFAASILYTFEGTVSRFQSYHQNYDIDDFDLTVGETSLKYIFEVDFDNGQLSSANGAGTWDYFNSDILEGSIINNGTSDGERKGFNWNRPTAPNVGQISGNLAGGDVRITTSVRNTTDWRVQDWEIGQTFSSIDGACYSGGSSGCAVYAFGDVTLTSITAVPVPAAFILFVSGICGLRLISKKS